MRQVETDLIIITGVCNGDELPLLFKYPDLKIKEGSQDYAFSKSLVKLWVQFSKDECVNYFCLKFVFNLFDF
jgi:hypothetical protein